MNLLLHFFSSLTNEYIYSPHTLSFLSIIAFNAGRSLHIPLLYLYQ